MNKESCDGQWCEGEGAGVHFHFKTGELPPANMPKPAAEVNSTLKVQAKPNLLQSVLNQFEDIII